MKYKKILLKLSGEALKNQKEDIIDFEYLKEICIDIKKIFDSNVQIGIVIGGGNIWRGRNNADIDIEYSDRIGIISTSINALAIFSVFEKNNIKSKLVNAFDIENIIEDNRKIDIDELLKENIVIFGGGTGKSGCSTDTAASLRAIEMNADLIIKLTNVDGVYDKDPNKYSNAIKYEEISFDEAIEKELKVMDKSSMILCRDNSINIIVMNIKHLNKLSDVLNGEKLGTLIK